MKRNVKNICLTLFSSLFLLVLMLAVACSGGSKMSVYNAKGELVFDSKTTSITVEYGEAYALPANVQIKGKKVELDKLTLLDTDGNECKLSYGSYRFAKVGEYKVNYTVGDDVSTFTICCVDTVAPVIGVHGATLFGIVGNYVTVPNFTAEDIAGIDKESASLVVTDPDGNVITLSDNRSFLVEKEGEYKLVYSVADTNGNTSVEEFFITGFPAYIDGTRENSVIYNFNYAEYLNLTMDVPKKLDAKHEIVDTGYPTIENEPDGNKVLKITSDATFDDIYTRFVLHENLLASTGRRIVVRFAVSADTDYIKIFKNQSSLDDRGLVTQKFGLKANTWYDLEINPISFGYNVAFKDFVVMFRDIDETALYIDEIYFTPIEFEDEDLAENVIADFDETGYLVNVYQNVFGDPTTTRNGRVGGSKFSIVSGEDLPNANSADTHTPLLAPSGSALRVETHFNRGGVTFMFPEPIDLNEIISLKMRFYVEKLPNVVVVGFFNGKGYDGGNNYWMSASNSKYYDNEWNEVALSAEYLKSYTANDQIAGFYLYTNVREDVSGDVKEHEHVVYIDEISVVKRNANCEQTGTTIASFSSENSLANVVQNGKHNYSTFTYLEEKFEREGVLAIEPAKSYSGVKYFFDRPFRPMEKDALRLHIATESTSAETLNIYVLNGPTDTLVHTCSLSTYAGAFKWLVINGKILMNAGVFETVGIRLEIKTSSAGVPSTLYLDEITVFDMNLDADKPEIFASSTSENYVVWDGKPEVDFSLLDISVADETDLLAEWYIVSLKNPSGVDITADIANKKFVPSSAGTYVVTVKAKDFAGNESEDTIEIAIHVSKATSASEYYRTVWQFNTLTSKQFITGAQLERSSVGTDNYAVSGLIKYDDLAPSGRQDLAIDMGGLYKVKEIESITVRYRYLNDALVDNKYVNIHLNVNGDKEQNNRLTGLTYVGANTYWYEAKATANFETLKITQDNLKSNILEGTLLKDEDVLTSLNFSQPSWRNSATAMQCRVRMEIDRVEVKLVPQFKAEYLEFNVDGALDMVEGIGAKLVDLGNGNKAVQATFKNDSLNDPTTTADDDVANKVNFRIYTGKVYKVSEIESVEISYKIISGDANLWWRLNLNDIYADNRRVMGAGLVTYSSATTSRGTPTANFETITITGEGLKKNVDKANSNTENTILSDDDYLTAISFSNSSRQNDLKYRCTIQIDYIRVNLKAKA